MPLGARAYQTKAAAAAMPVRLPDGQQGAMLAKAVALNPILRPAEEDEPCPAQVRLDDAGGLTIWDHVGPLHQPQPSDPLGIDHIVQNLKRLAWANGLRSLAPDLAHTLQAEIDVEFGVVNDGEAEPLSTSGAILYLGQRIYVRITNKSDERVYVSLVDIGVSSKVAVLDMSSPSGAQVEPGNTYTFGWNDVREVLQGSALSWPAGLARTLPRPETMVILVTSHPQDIRGLEQQGIRGSDRSFVIDDRPRSPLERLLDQIDRGGTRDLTADTGPGVRYTVRTVDFQLVPMPPPVSEDPDFQVDERPEQSILLWSPKSAAPATVAVRLSDLVVHRNRAFGSADIRLDAMVLTRGQGKQPVYSTQTERFRDISDGQTLPMDKMLIYHGEAIDYLDIAVWVSRDASDSLALADLMAEKLTDNDLQMAMGQAGGLLMTAPQAAMAVAAIGAGAVLINAAYHLLTGIVGNSIGLYRTTMLAGERFGIGRPAEQRLVRAQDFSFTYLIEDVG